VLYEQVLLKEITLEDYKAQKADVDAELERLRQVQGALSAEIAQAKMDAKTKNARWYYVKKKYKLKVNFS
jgi:hypothetical protein